MPAPGLAGQEQTETSMNGGQVRSTSILHNTSRLTTVYKEGANVQSNCATPGRFDKTEQERQGVVMVRTKGSPCAQHHRRPLALCETRLAPLAVSRLRLPQLLCTPDKPRGGKSETSNCARSSDVPRRALFPPLRFPLSVSSLSALDVFQGFHRVCLGTVQQIQRKHANTGVVWRPHSQSPLSLDRSFLVPG